jgi:hypothetical protein
MADIDSGGVGVKLGASWWGGSPTSCKSEKLQGKEFNGGAERDRTRYESIPTVGLWIRPLSLWSCKPGGLEYSFFSQL